MITLTDYHKLCVWWSIQKFNPPTIDDLPVINGELQGVIVSQDDIDICAGFIIDTSIKNGAIFEYLVANFFVKDKELRDEAFSFLFEVVFEISRKMGKKYLFTSVKNQSLINRYEKVGFKKASVGTVEMIKAL